MAYGDANQFAAPGSVSTAGNTGPIACEKGLNLHVLVDVSVWAVSLGIAIQWSMDGTNFGPADPADAFANIAATGRVVKTFAVRAPFFRVAWTPGGACTFTLWKYVTV